MNKLSNNNSKVPKTDFIKSPETSSEFVRIAHKINSFKSQAQLVKIGDKFFKVKELG